MSSASLKPTHLHDALAPIPTVSHPPAIAKGDHQRANDPDTENLGWSHDPKVPIPVIQGMNNEHLWILVRRFNKQVFHLRRIPDPSPDILDCTSATTPDSYSPEKLRSVLERFYLTIVIGTAASIKHIARIRSWTETTRTAWFCILYFLAWFNNMLIPAFLAFISTLVFFPSSRPILFPPAPLAAIDSSTGGLKIPPAGHLGSKDSMTGAQEQFRGEAAEREADSFVTGLSSIAVSVAVGKQGEAKSPTDEGLVAEDHVDTKVPDIANVASAVGAQQAASAAATPSEDIQKQTAAPIQQAMWDNITLIVSAINAVIDVWEMFGNALTSSPPFEALPMRVWAVFPFVILLFISLVLPEFWIYKGFTGAIGMALFGQPLFDALSQKNFLKYLDRTIPHWREYLDIRNTILYGAPTDKQLTLTLLRLGETNKSPLPPPPLISSSPDPGDSSSQLPPSAHFGDLPPEYSDQVDQVNASSSPSQSESSVDEDDANTPRKRRGSKVLGFVKGTTKAGVESVLGLEKAKAVVGSKAAKARTGIVQPPEAVEKAQMEDGPSVFRGKWQGTKGVLTISTTATQSLLAFSKSPGLNKDVEIAAPAETVVWTLLIDDIAEIKKVGGFGWKGKFVVGWSTGSKVIDGMEITDLRGNTYHLTALPRRDELFNRLVSIGKQRWESC
ncbi:hypothetical protein GYMLUDRAFT_34288 [Collybiopsis luxurians FD-317 M1]|nr:hypothetical protein GYMLUDRAFT_34288 [Collybiopsis luxurians FD-317 M1]